MYKWQMLFLMWLISTTSASLLYRRFAVKSQLDPLVSGGVRAILVSAPLMWVIALVIGGFAMPPLKMIGLALAEAILGLVYGVASFRAIKQSDASTFTTLVKLSVIPLVFISSNLLGEGLSPTQLIGAILLLMSGFIIGKVTLTKNSIKWMTISIVVIAVMNILDRFIVESVGVVTALTTILTLGALVHIPVTIRGTFQNKERVLRELPSLLVLGGTTFIQIVAFVWATDRAGNLSLLYSLSASKVVLVTVAAAVLLGERENLILKISSALIATVGILLI